MGIRISPREVWQAQRPGEDPRAWQDRLSHSCWKCGAHIRGMTALDAHEETCARPETTKSPLPAGPKPDGAGA